MAKEFFKSQNLEYTEFDVSTDIPHQQEMIQKSGQMGVPVIDIDGNMVIGFDKPKVEQLLSAGGEEQKMAA
jgi:glutaredoxin 3